MPDGSTVSIIGPCHYLAGLPSVVFGGAAPMQAAQPDLIRRSTGGVGPGGALIVELIRSCC